MNLSENRQPLLVTATFEFLSRYLPSALRLRLHHPQRLGTTVVGLAYYRAHPSIVLPGSRRLSVSILLKPAPTANMF